MQILKKINNNEFLGICPICEQEVIIKDKRSKKCKSCSAKLNGSKYKKHGMSKSKLYKIWKNMKSRCNATSGDYAKYYENITYCKEWNEFDNFYKWSLKNDYKDGLSLDRINVNGNYEPSNCRFVNRSVQSANKRKCLNSSNKYKNIYLDKRRNTYFIVIEFEGKKYRKSGFKDIELAKVERDKIITDFNLSN